jgi:hypothetical protein
MSNNDKTSNTSPSALTTPTTDNIALYIQQAGIRLAPAAIAELEYMLTSLPPGKEKQAAIDKVLEMAGYVSAADRHDFNTGLNKGFQLSSDMATRMIGALGNMIGVDASTVHLDGDVKMRDVTDVEEQPVVEDTINEPDDSIDYSKIEE